MDALADAYLQSGKTELSKSSLELSTSIQPHANPAKWFYLAQLQQAEEALHSYTTGIHYLQVECDSCMDSSLQDAYRKQISRAYSSISELYLTDLCLEENAESKCEEAVEKSLEIDVDNLDGMLTKASLRLSQCRPNDAATVAEILLGKVNTLRETASSKTIQQEMEDSDPSEVGEVSSALCVSLAKILLECSCVQPSFVEETMFLLESLLDENDEQIEVWLLLGIACISSTPPDVEEATGHFLHTKSLIEVERKAESGDSLAYESEYEVVLRHLRDIESGVFSEEGQRLRAAARNSGAVDEEWSDEEDS